MRIIRDILDRPNLRHHDRVDRIKRLLTLTQVDNAEDVVAVGPSKPEQSKGHINFGVDDIETDATSINSVEESTV